MAYNEDDGQVLEYCVYGDTQILLCQHLSQQGCSRPHAAIPTKLFEPVYMTPTSMTLMGNHIFASFMSKSLNEIIPIFFTTNTHVTQTDD